MRIWAFSDLHNDTNRSDPFERRELWPAHDIIAIAGDICEDMVAGVRWIVERGLNRRPVIYVAGNHEFFGADRFQMLDAAIAEARRSQNIHILQNDCVELDGVSFLGTTFWTDYRLFGEQHRAAAMLRACQTVNDHRRIRIESRTWLPADAAAEHISSREYLQAALSRCEGPAVVVTHHAPSIRSVHARFRSGELSAAFASNCEALASQASVWIHGHTHDPFDYRLGQCRVVCNPRGYHWANEGHLFEPFKVIEVNLKNVSTRIVAEDHRLETRA